MSRPQLAAGKSTKIACLDENHPTNAGTYLSNFNALGIFPNIQIWCKDKNGMLRKTFQVFETTAHELGHQAHARLINSVQFVQVSKYVIESWATAVGWAITDSEYKYWGNKLGIADILNKPPLNSWARSSIHRHDAWPEFEQKQYSPLFIDLVDNVNQSVYNTNLPNDQVSGYTMKFLNERVLPNAYGLASLQKTLKNHLINGVSSEQIDLLFELYHNLPNI